MKLKLEQVSKSFGPATVLREISLVLENVRSVVLLGPSGGGKSTLLRLLGGLDTPSGGAIEVNDQPLSAEEEALRRYRSSVGTVFQAFNLFPHLSALANLTLPLEKVHGVAPEEARARADAELARFGLAEHAHKRPAELSGGQRQRVAIARALSIRPKLLLFDEPTSALDPEMTAEVLEAIAALRAEQRDLILVTHQMSFARAVADHALFLAEGRIVESSPGPEFFTNPREKLAQDFLAKVLRY